MKTPITDLLQRKINDMASELYDTEPHDVATDPAELCDAWIKHAGDVIRCNKMADHYVEGETGTMGEQTGRDWHTNCPLGNTTRPDGHEHAGAEPCLVWNDNADGAHPAHGHLKAVAANESERSEENESGRTTETVPVYTAEIKFRDNAGKLIVSGNLYGPADALSTAVAVIADGFEKWVQR